MPDEPRFAEVLLTRDLPASKAVVTMTLPDEWLELEEWRFTENVQGALNQVRDLFLHVYRLAQAGGDRD